MRVGEACCPRREQVILLRFAICTRIYELGGKTPPHSRHAHEIIYNSWLIH